MNRWYRLALPHASTWWLMVGIIVVFDCFAIGTTAFGVLNGNRLESWFALLFLLISVAISTGFAAPLGWYRLTRLPLNKNRLQQWLDNTPWTAATRTPFGPWYPVRQDLIILGVLCLMNGIHLAGPVWLAVKLEFLESHLQWGPQLCALTVAPVIVFFSAWLLGCWILVIRNRWTSIVYPLAYIGICLQVGFYTLPMYGLSLCVIGIPISAAFVRHRLNKLLIQLPTENLACTATSHTAVPMPAIFSLLGPQRPKAADFQRRIRGMAVPVTAVAFCYLSVIPWAWNGTCLAWLCLVLAALMRSASFQAQMQSHLSIAARIATKRWLVPEFDRIWLPSLYMAATSSAFLYLGWIEVIPLRFASTFMILGSTLIGLMSGPDYEQWFLTAPATYHDFTRQTQSRRR